jgi:hypothetical protein
MWALVRIFFGPRCPRRGGLAGLARWGEASEGKFVLCGWKPPKGMKKSNVHPSARLSKPFYGRPSSQASERTNTYAASDEYLTNNATYARHIVAMPRAREFTRTPTLVGSVSFVPNLVSVGTVSTSRSRGFRNRFFCPTDLRRRLTLYHTRGSGSLF